jgi:hypothetical protein
MTTHFSLRQLLKKTYVTVKGELSETHITDPMDKSFVWYGLE